jgi:hypothetical protein
LNGTDPDGDAITYCWEEADLGPEKPGNAPDNGSSALFRSFLPTFSPARTFPRFPALLANNTQTLGEKLPLTTRKLDFRVTVRDVRPIGGFGMDIMRVNVVDSGQGFEVTAPTAQGITYSGGSTQTITWNVANTTSAPINTTMVNILLAPTVTPNQAEPSFPIVLAANTPNDGSEVVTIPMVNTNSARVMVQPVDNIYFDISNENFTITAPPVQLTGAASRKVHGTTPYDIPLPSTGQRGIECRSGSGDGNQHTIVFTFDSPILSVGSAGVTEGNVVSSGVNPSNPNEYIVELAGLQSGRTFTATLNNVNGSGSASVTFGVLLGDTTGNGIVNSSDITQTKGQSGLPVSATNFRLDVTVSDSINASDVSIVKSRSGTFDPIADRKSRLAPSRRSAGRAPAPRGQETSTSFRLALQPSVAGSCATHGEPAEHDCDRLRLRSDAQS